MTRTRRKHSDDPLPVLPPREPDTHKGTYGRVLIVAGSPGMLGAAILAARGALRSGAGLTTIAVSTDLANAVPPAVPEATLLLLPPRSEPSFATESARRLGDLAERFDALAVGPGLGLDLAARSLVGTVLAAAVPQVVDADALNLVALGLAAPRTDLRVWTPHPGEFRRLEHQTPHGDAERFEAAAGFAARRGGVVVLKGHHTVVHDGRRGNVNSTGNPGMATGGSGDVLSGVIAALLARGLSPFDSARLGVYLHGLAGDLAARQLGQDSLIAGDIVEHLPAAFGQLDRTPSSE